MIVIDRIENEIAVCEMEDGNTLYIALTLLPDNAAEGDVLQISEESGYLIDSEATQLRKKAMHSRLTSLFNRSSEET